MRVCMHAHTTITPFMHELDIACKNVLISHSSMMHAYACCTCNLISPCTKKLCFLSHWLRYPIIQMISLMHHFITARTGMRSPDQCSISCLFTPTFCKFALWVVATKGAVGYNGHTKCAYTRATYFYDYGVTCMSVLHLYAYSK